VYCPFTLNLETGLWQCHDCGWVYKKKSDKPPHRNCPAKLTPEQQAEREAQRQAAMAEQERAAAHGAGTYLHRLLKRLTGEGITASCRCTSHIATMNRNGPAWCRENVDTIVGWLEEEIERRVKVATIAANDVIRLTKECEVLQKKLDRLCNGNTCELGRKKYTKDLDNLKQQLTQAEKDSKLGWQLKLAGWKLPGQRLASKRLILLAIRLAERADRKTNE